MITGKSSGSGKYSYHEMVSGNRSVMVSRMPEDGWQIRIAVRHNGETHLPIVKMDKSDAERLWAALCEMAKDLNWKTYEQNNHGIK